MHNMHSNGQKPPATGNFQPYTKVKDHPRVHPGSAQSHSNSCQCQRSNEHLVDHCMFNAILSIFFCCRHVDQRVLPEFEVQLAATTASTNLRSILIHNETSFIEKILKWEGQIALACVAPKYRCMVQLGSHIYIYILTIKMIDFYTH